MPRSSRSRLSRAAAGLNEQTKRADEKLARLAEGDEVVARLRSVPGVGVVTAMSFVSTRDDHSRFAFRRRDRCRRPAG